MQRFTADKDFTCSIQFLHGCFKLFQQSAFLWTLCIYTIWARNAFPDSLVTSAEMANDSVAKFTSLLRAYDHRKNPPKSHV